MSVDGVVVVVVAGVEFSVVVSIFSTLSVGSWADGGGGGGGTGGNCADEVAVVGGIIETVLAAR